MATVTTITKILQELQHMPNSPVNDVNVGKIVDQYAFDLADIPDEVLAAAALYYRTGSNQFFPTSGQLREKATDIYLTALDIPTAHQAWAEVISAVRFVDSTMCEDCVSLWKMVDGKTGAEYWTAIHAYQRHTNECDVYQMGGFKDVYSHPIVEDIVFQMGGRDNLLNGDISVCRSHFIRGYNEIILNRTKRAVMPPPVKEVVNRIAGDQIKMLAEGMGR